MSFIEYATANEVQFDFCLWEYPPASDPTGKLRSVCLLANSFAGLRSGRHAMAMLDAVRTRLGPSRTVWGVKQTDREISWELYFYDYARADRRHSVADLLGTIRPWVSCAASIPDSVPYFMFSVDLSSAMLESGGHLDEVQIYIGNIGSAVSSGICYGVSPLRTWLKNFYFFFDARSEMEQIEGKVATSMFVGGRHFNPESVIWPELRDCEVIVVANKSDRDGIYFSRISAPQLLWFLERMEYPQAQTRYLRDNLGLFDHMRYDVGFDYRMENGRIKVIKSAYYGIF